MSLRNGMGGFAPSLKSLAPLYKVFLFNYSAVADSSRLAQRARTLRCMRELIDRGKRVVLVHDGPVRASALKSLASRSGVPEQASTWSSGEFIYKELESRRNSGQPFQHLFPTMKLDGSGALQVYELSAVATPKRWADRVSRPTAPFLAPLEAMQAVRRVDDLEKAQLCFWDVSDADEVKDIIDALLELCVEYRIPLLHASACEAALRALGKEGVQSRSPQGYALSLNRLGGQSFGVGKLEGCLDSLAQPGAETESPRDVLLVSSDLSDVIESSAHGMDSLLLLDESKSHLRSQMSALAEAERLEEQKARRSMSVSQRVQADSPAMMHAASAPFMSFLKLPALIAEASRKNAEHRAAGKADVTAGGRPQQVSSHPGREPMTKAQQSSEELWQAVQAWCRASSVQLPVAAMPSLEWDEDGTSEDRTTAPTQPSSSKFAVARAKANHAATSSSPPAMSFSSSGARAGPALRMAATTSQGGGNGMRGFEPAGAENRTGWASSGTLAQPESVSDIFSKLSSETRTSGQ